MTLSEKRRREHAAVQALLRIYRTEKATRQRRRKKPRYKRTGIPPLLTAAPEPSLLYTPNEASAFLRLSPRTLERWRSVGGGPTFMKFGRRVLHQGSALLEFVEAQQKDARIVARRGG